MNGTSPAANEFFNTFGLRQAYSFLALILLYLLPHAIFADSLLLPLALVGCGVAVTFIDLSCLDLVPTAFPTEHARQAARTLVIAAGAMVGFMALTSAATPGKFEAGAVLILLVRVIVATAIGVYTWPSFRDDVYPLMREQGTGTLEYAEALAGRAAEKGEEHRVAKSHEAGVAEARRVVLDYYRANRKSLQRRFSGTWLEGELKIRIPAGTADEQARAAAGALIAEFEAHVNERRGQIAEVTRELEQVRASRERLRGDDTLDAETLREELAELDRRERDLLGRRKRLENDG
jgi:hypothetical protein